MRTASSYQDSFLRPWSIASTAVMEPVQIGCNRNLRQPDRLEARSRFRRHRRSGWNSRKQISNRETRRVVAADDKDVARLPFHLHHVRSRVVAGGREKSEGHVQFDRVHDELPLSTFRGILHLRQQFFPEIVCRNHLATFRYVVLAANIMVRLPRWKRLPREESQLACRPVVRLFKAAAARTTDAPLSASSIIRRSCVIDG